MGEICRYIIHGRVQGVGFRHFTLQIADAFDVRGFVRNLPDGTVEVVAAAVPENLRAFREQMELGPPGARVDRVVTAPTEPQRFPDFRVVR